MRIQKEYDLGPDPLKTKELDTGNWNLNSTVSISVAHGLVLADIRECEAFIRNDVNTELFPIDHSDGLVNPDGKIKVDATNVVLTKRVGGLFSGVDWDSVAYNRGWIQLRYR